MAPSLGMLVETTNLGTYIGTVLLIAVASTIGMFLCILPGLAVIFFCAYAPLIALDKGVGPADAKTWLSTFAIRGADEAVKALGA